MIVGITMHQPPVSAAAHPALDHLHNSSSNNISNAEASEFVPGGGYVEDNTYSTHHYHHHHHYESATTMNAVAASAVPPTMQQHTSSMNDDAVQHPVYVSSSEVQQQHHSGMMVGMEQQFAQFGIQQQDGTDRLASSAHNDSSENNDTEHNEGGEDLEEEPVKLFVGQVPKALNEEDIFPTFDSFGPLKDVAVIRDKHTGIHRGCAFVTYWSALDAERAREALHDKFTFPGGKRAAQVKPAEPSAIPENKLFIGMLSRTCEEEEVREQFSQFGEIREVYMIRNADGSSKCAAFLRFADRESAVQAIEMFNGVEVMEGAQRPLIVKFADNKLQRQQRHIRNIRRHEMMAMIGPGGYAYPPQGPPIGIGMHPSAGTQYSMPPVPPQAYIAAAYGPGAQAPPHPYMYPSHYGQVPPYAYPKQHHEHQESTRPANPRPREGPAGANLFVYHLPHDLTDADLATAFNPFGNVISAKVYVDKFTGESKGFGFVSYDSIIAAEQAIEQMNGFQIGNKRLKVQHKRVHISNINNPYPVEPQSPTSSGDSSASELPNATAGG